MTFMAIEVLPLPPEIWLPRRKKVGVIFVASNGDGPGVRLRKRKR